MALWANDQLKVEGWQEMREHINEAGTSATNQGTFRLDRAVGAGLFLLARGLKLDEVSHRIFLREAGKT